MWAGKWLGKWVGPWLGAVAVPAPTPTTDEDTSSGGGGSNDAVTRRRTGPRYAPWIPALHPWRIAGRSRVRSRVRGHLVWQMPVRGASQARSVSSPAFLGMRVPLGGTSAAVPTINLRLLVQANSADYWEAKCRLGTVQVNNWSQRVGAADAITAKLHSRISVLEAEVTDLEDLLALELAT